MSALQVASAVIVAALCLGSAVGHFQRRRWFEAAAWLCASAWFGFITWSLIE